MDGHSKRQVDKQGGRWERRADIDGSGGRRTDTGTPTGLCRIHSVCLHCSSPWCLSHCQPPRPGAFGAGAGAGQGCVQGSESLWLQCGRRGPQFQAIDCKECCGGGALQCFHCGAGRGQITKLGSVPLRSGAFGFGLCYCSRPVVLPACPGASSGTLFRRGLPDLMCGAKVTGLWS